MLMLGSHLWIACYSLHFAKTDDIELKSSIGGKEDISFSKKLIGIFWLPRSGREIVKKFGKGKKLRKEFLRRTPTTT
jgi:hypothetical protein